MNLSPFLLFEGNCAEAMQFYQSCLGGELEVTLLRDTPMKDQMPAEHHAKIVHARLNVGDKVLMGSDAPPGRFEGAKGISVILGVDQAAEAERVFKALSENGAVSMPIAETFWALRFGMLTDQFGIPWMVNCERAHP